MVIFQDCDITSSYAIRSDVTRTQAAPGFTPNSVIFPIEFQMNLTAAHGVVMSLTQLEVMLLGLPVPGWETVLLLLHFLCLSGFHIQIGSLLSWFSVITGTF